MNFKEQRIAQLKASSDLSGKWVKLNPEESGKWVLSVSPSTWVPQVLQKRLRVWAHVWSNLIPTKHYFPAILSWTLVKIRLNNTRKRRGPVVFFLGYGASSLTSASRENHWKPSRDGGESLGWRASGDEVPPHHGRDLSGSWTKMTANSNQIPQGGHQRHQ